MTEATKKPHIYLFFGDAFLIKDKMKKWKEMFIQKYGDDDVIVLDGYTTDANTISMECITPPMFSEKRFICVENIPFGTDYSSTELKKLGEKEKYILAQIDRIPENNIVIFLSEKPDKRKTLFKKFQKEATLGVEDISNISDMEKQKYISTWSSGKISTHMASILYRKMTDPDMFTLYNTVQKICTYAENNEITEEIIDKIIIQKTHFIIWNLTEKIAARNPTGIFQEIENALQTAESIYAIFPMVCQSIQNLLRIKLLLENNIPRNEIAKAANLHPFVVQKTLPHIQKYTKEDLKKCISQLIYIDKARKTGKIQTDQEFFLALKNIFLKTS
jgi:DNA polymerase III subunit delta